MERGALCRSERLGLGEGLGSGRFAVRESAVDGVQVARCILALDLHLERRAAVVDALRACSFLGRAIRSILE